MNKLPINESLTVEFKSSFNKDVIETLVAFANASGGTVFIGASDNGKPQGVNIEKDTVQNWVNEIKNETEPQIIPELKTLDIGGKDIVALSVCEYPVKPVSTRGRFFKRINNLNHLLGAVEIADEHLKTINSSWDFYIDPNHTKLDLSREKIEIFANKIRHNKKIGIAQLSDTELLNKMEILRYNKITFGAYLMFVKDYCLFSDVQISRLKNDGSAIAAISINTDLFQELEEITAFVKKHVIFNCPHTAVREIVLNMIIHRDYKESSPSVIKIFDDRIEFYNPGKLYDDIKIGDLFSDNYISKSRNKLIARSFKESGAMHHHSSGIMRICRACREYGIREPVFRETLNGFKVILHNEKIDMFSALSTRNDTLSGAVKPANDSYQSYGVKRPEVEPAAVKPAGDSYLPYGIKRPETETAAVKPASESYLPYNIKNLEEQNAAVKLTNDNYRQYGIKRPETETAAVKPASDSYLPYNIKNLEEQPVAVKPAGESYQPYNIKDLEEQPDAVKPASGFINIEISAPKRNTLNKPVTDTIKLSETQEKIRNEIRKKPDITSQELADIVKITVRNIKANIAKLKERGLIDRVGARKNGYWKVIDL